MKMLAKWHVWLGWLVGLPILMWTITGLIMVARPIDEVRGNHLRAEQAPEALVLPDAFADSAIATSEFPIQEIRTIMQDGRAIAQIKDMDGNLRRIDFATGEPIAPLTASEAGALVARRINGGDQVVSVTSFAADEVPIDFRRPMAVWQVALKDGAHIYVGKNSGKIEAVRTRFWRVFDFAWGLHIMDLKTRSDTSHPILILFAALAAIGALMGCVLMFRRRKSTVKAAM